MSCWREKATGAVTRSRPRGSAARSRTPAKLSAMCSKAPRVSSTRRWPASVRRTLRVVRVTRATPAARSSSATRWLMAALLTPRRAAAEVKLPCCSSTTSQCRWLHKASALASGFSFAMQRLFSKMNNQFKRSA